MGENSSKKNSGCGTLIIIVLALFSLLMMCSGGDSDVMVDTETCGVCGKEFINPVNIKSIQNTTMCKKCYNDFQRKQEKKEGETHSQIIPKA